MRAETKILNETTLGDSGAVPTLTNLNSGFSELSSILELLRQRIILMEPTFQILYFYINNLSSLT